MKVPVLSEKEYFELPPKQQQGGSQVQLLRVWFHKAGATMEKALLLVDAYWGENASDGIFVPLPLLAGGEKTSGENILKKEGVLYTHQELGWCTR